jgi:signal transduction histidine kinase/ligand-binding sensor domain-containing protein
VITSIYQDRAGFIWIGSRDGLTLYDGYSFIVFEHDASDPASISDNTIRTVYEDSHGNLWLGTNTGGLNRLDRATWEFEHFRHDSADSTSLSHDSVYAILEDRTGALWVGTQMGLNRFDPETETFERFFSDPGDPRSLSHDYVYGLHEDTEGGLWISTVGGGLNFRNPETGTFSAYRHDPGDLHSLSYDNVFVIADGPAGKLWVSTAEGLNLLDPRTGSVRRVGQDPRSGPLLSDPLLPALAQGPEGKLWIATHGGGLNQLDPATGEIRVWRHDPAKRNSLGSDEVIALLSDSIGGLWIGTWGGGLNRLSPRSLLLSESAHLAKMPDDLDVNDVTALMIDRAGGIWLGTRSGDVVRRDIDRMTDHPYLRGGAGGTPRIILGFAEAPSGQIWIATNGGVIHLDPATGEQVSYYHDQEDPTSLGPGYVKGILMDRAGRLWVGTGEGGVQRLDTDGRVLARFVHDAEDPASLSDNYVTTLFEDSRGKLWVGTRSGGLNSLDPRTGRIARHQPGAGDTGTISHHYVTSIVEDSSGTLWVGTGGGGLNRVGRLEGGGLHFTRFTEAGGLIDDDVMGIQEDDDGSLWISTKRGLTRFDPKTGSFANLNVADGLPSGEFEPATVARSDSILYFGTVKGLVAIPAGTTFPSPSASPTVITSIRTSSEELGAARPVWDLGRLKIPWGEWLSLRFAVLDYSADRRHRYQYRLGGVDEDWIDLGSSREITFTDLDPGSYDFNVRGRNSQGVWSTAEPTLQLDVVPPFWMTTWFRAAVGLFVVSMVIVGHRVRVNAVEKRNRELVALYEQREKARRELGEAYERLTRLTRRLEAAKEDERRTIARELHDEMGPSLTAVIINLQLLAEDRDPARKSRRIHDTIGLVDRMVDRIRDLSLDLRPPLLDELGLVPALKGYLEGQADRAGIEIEVVESTPTDDLPPETEIAAFRVVQEAVTNVIRHADASLATVTIGQSGGGLELAVRDDGVGFDLRATMERAAAGKALGLLGMQERVRMLDGEIRIDSQPGRGTHIRVSLPVAVPS